MARTLTALVLMCALVPALRAAAPEQAIPLGSDGCNHTFARAGYPDHISRCAAPSNTPAYAGYYVGGGCVFAGGPPGPLQGTWGWDYFTHRLYHPCVVLNWCDCRYQGGTGSYRTDRCPVPNVFAVKIGSRGEGGEGGEGHGEGHGEEHGDSHHH
jgi:hypothetical protein